MKLRNYQLELIEQIHTAWDTGSQNVLMQLSTGGGKTVVFCEVVRQLNVPTIVIAHRVELVSQISLTLARNGIYHNILGQLATIRDIVATHMHDLGRSYYDRNALVHAAGIDAEPGSSICETAWFGFSIIRFTTKSLRIIGVATPLGCIELTRMLCGANAFAAERIMPSTPVS